MIPNLPPIGFWSYAREDDEQKLGRLRSLLSAQLQQQHGKEPIRIFQDVAAIPPGAEWETKIRQALEDSSFFIPIVTPSFLESKWCNEELLIYLAREKELVATYPQLAGERRIFPIYYVDADGVDALRPEIAPELARLQRLDFRDLIYKDVTSEEVQVRMSVLARSLAQLLRRDRRIMTGLRAAEKAHVQAVEVRPQEQVQRSLGNAEEIRPQPMLVDLPNLKTAPKAEVQKAKVPGPIFPGPGLWPAVARGVALVAVLALAYVIYQKLHPVPVPPIDTVVLVEDGTTKTDKKKAPPGYGVNDALSQAIGKNESGLLSASNPTQKQAWVATHVLAAYRLTYIDGCTLNLLQQTETTWVERDVNGQCAGVSSRVISGSADTGQDVLLHDADEGGYLRLPAYSGPFYVGRPYPVSWRQAGIASRMPDQPAR